MPLFYIQLRNVRFYAYHGVGEQETRVGAEYVVNLKAGLPMPPGCFSDNVAQTLNYAELYEEVRREFEKPCRLIEHLATNIAAALARRFEELESLEIEIVKVHPPIPSFTGSAAVEIFFEKKELKNLVN